MNNSLKKLILSGIFLFIYCLLFYFLQTSQLRLDFASFYSAAQAYTQGTNPYKNLVAAYFTIPVKLPANLNPPFFLQLLSPLTGLKFQLASSLWFLGTLVLGSAGALLSIKVCSSEPVFRKYWLPWLFIYLGMYSTLINTGIGQIGGILLFFIMAGYYFYLQKQDFWAGICWGIIIAMKLFPALLFLFALNQQRYRVFGIMLASSVFAFFLPLITHGWDIYSLYFNMLPRIMWFGDNWNASLYGFLFRLFIEVKSHQNLGFIKCAYVSLLTISLIWFIYKIRSWKIACSAPLDHRDFCLTLAMMMFLSPLGWLYCFSLFLMPLTIIWQSFNQTLAPANSKSALWVISVLLINFPLGYVEAATMHSLLSLLTVYSIYFYGLVIIVYLLNGLKCPVNPIRSRDIEKNKEGLYPLKITLALGLFVTLGSFLLHLTGS